MTGEEILEMLKGLESDRSNLDSRWQDCANYGMPQNSQITHKRAPGQKPPIDLFDTTLEESNIQLASGLYSYMFPTDGRAFVLEVDDTELNEKEDIKQWCEKATKVIHKYLVSSNFRQSFFEFLKSLGCFGTACFYVSKGKKKPIVFINFHMAGVYIMSNSDGDIDTVLRTFEYTARQAVQEFGYDNLSEDIKTAYDNPEKRKKKFRFVHAVMPREDYDDSKDDSINMPWASIYVDRKTKEKIKDKGTGLPESGYPEMPYQVDRFDKDSQEDYGRSPMMKKLPDGKMANTMAKTRIKGWEKMVDPPVILPDDGSVWPLATKPGGTIYKRAGSEGPEYWEFKGNLATMEEAILTTQNTIKKGFFLDMFDPLIDRQNMTATEVMARIDQMMRFLTPIIGRLQSELFNPMVNRIIGVLSRQNKKGGKTLLPEMPTELSEADYSVMYLGRLALALRTIETEGLQKTLAQWSPLAEANIFDWLDNIAVDDAFRDSARNNGVPATWLKDINERDKERMDKAKKENARALMEQMPGIAGAAKDLSKAPEDGSITKGMIDAA